MGTIYTQLSKRQKPKFDRDVSILFRPDDVAHRREFGHWESDLMLFEQKRGQMNVTSSAERVSRFTVILKNPNKRTKPVMGKGGFTNEVQSNKIKLA